MSWEGMWKFRCKCGAILKEGDIALLMRRVASHGFEHGEHDVVEVLEEDSG